jgi:hypothetical protein
VNPNCSISLYTTTVNVTGKKPNVPIKLTGVLAE